VNGRLERYRSIRYARRVALTLVPGAVGAALTACAPGGSAGSSPAPSPASGPVTLHYWRQYGEQHQQSLAHQAVIADYLAKNPGRAQVDISDEGGPAGGVITPLTKIQTLVAAGNPPDLWQTDHISSAQLFSLGALADMNAALRTNKDWTKLKSELVPNLLEVATWKGQMTIMPVTYGPQGLAFNKRHLAEAAVPLPPLRYTWNDFVEIGRKVARPPDRWLFFFQYNALRFGMWWRVNGQRPMSADNTKVLFDTPQMRETLQWCHDQVTQTQLFRNGPTNFNAGEAVTDHTNVAAVTGPQYPNIDPGDGSGIFLTHYPLGPSNTKKDPVITGNTFGFSVFKAAGDKKIAAAAELALWAVRPEAQAKHVDASNLFPTNTTASKHPTFPKRFQDNPILRALNDLTPYGLPNPNFPSWTAAEAILTEHLQRVEKGELLPRDALAQAQPRMQALIDEDLKKG
jgi:multiple sugar transport system substrate-binding protein